MTTARMLLLIPPTCTLICELLLLRDGRHIFHDLYPSFSSFFIARIGICQLAFFLLNIWLIVRLLS
ncbi:hypothetical protein BC832DRAFT_122727 [Gaertneriomyces semiglobifer]|nr:hypothetical protein BC832DRAFT_122727 [Gaertneriomyces semiglobifer]